MSHQFLATTQPQRFCDIAGNVTILPNITLSNGVETIFLAATVLELLGVNHHRDGGLAGRTSTIAIGGTNLQLRFPLKVIECTKLQVVQIDSHVKVALVFTGGRYCQSADVCCCHFRLKQYSEVACPHVVKRCTAPAVSLRCNI